MIRLYDHSLGQYSTGMRTSPAIRRALASLALATGVTGWSQTPTAAPKTFQSEGVTINPGSTAGNYTYLSNGTLTLTHDIQSQATSAFLNSTLKITEFTASFTYLATTAQNYFADGATFVIQNSPQQTSALGSAGYGLGYVGITNSVAVAFNVFNAYGVGIKVAENGYFNGPYLNTSPVALDAQRPIRVQITYSGGVLSTNLMDLSNQDTFSTSQAINIPAIVGSEFAYVGFTGGTGAGVSLQQISNFSFTTSVPEPSVTILLVSGAAGIAWVSRRKRRSIQPEVASTSART